MDGSDNELPPLRREPADTSLARTGGVSASELAVSDNSSDSAFFSSDDLADASVDKYNTAFRKSQYKRAWYEEEHPSRLHTYKQMRQATRRPKDSGIYMNSDSSNSSADDGFSVSSIKARSPTKKAVRKLEPFRKPPRPVRRAAPSSDSLVRAAIDTIVDKGEEKLDLMDHGLSSLPHDAFIPLGTYVRRLRFDSSPYTEQSAHSLTPSLQVFLGKNNLQRVPGSLVGLSNLKVLSLRHNSLAELPPAIGLATQLTELNLSCNGLRWLPWELFALCQDGQLTGLRARPNPFFKPSEASGAADVDEEIHARPTDMNDGEPRYKHRGTTAFSFFEPCGVTHKKSPMAPSTALSDVLEISTQPKEALKRHVDSRVPSLFEIALRSCTDTASTQEAVVKVLPPDAPQAVVDGLDRGAAVTYQGGRKCSVCGRSYIVARAEWIEFWHDTSTNGPDATLPFLRQTCSWGCALDAEV